MNQSQEEQQIKRRTLFSVYSIAFLDNFGFALVLILFAPLVLHPSYGFFSKTLSEGNKNILLGLLLAAFPLFLFFGAPFWGDYADRFGRKKAFCFTVLGTALGYLFSALAIFFKSYVLLFCTSALTGFFAGNTTLCLATISDLSPNMKEKGKRLGLWTVTLGVSWCIAMVLGGLLSDPKILSFFNPNLPFLLASLIAFFGYGILRLWFTETHIRKAHVHFDLIKSFHEIKEAIRIKSLSPLLFMVFFWSLGWVLTLQWFTAISLERFQASIEKISLYLVVLGITWTLGGGLINRLLVKKFPSKAIALTATSLTGLLLLISSIAQDYFLFSLFFWIAAITAPCGLSNNLNLISSSAPENIQGKAMGFTQSFQSLAALLIPFIGGFLARFNIHLIFPIGGLFLLISFFILLGSRTASKS